MPVSVEVMFDNPQREIASVLSNLYSGCSSAWLVSGFMTVEGVEAIKGALAAAPHKLEGLVVGAATWRAFDAFDRLLAAGINGDCLRINLGHSRQTGGSAKHRFYRYHPMLHSKVYLFDLPGGESAALVGSHNLTGFALHGLNGEAATLVRGPSGDRVFADLKAHVMAVVAGSNRYDPQDRDAYAWWASQFMEGFAAKFSDAPRDGLNRRTIVILAEASGPDTPREDDIIYFELPASLGKVQSMSSDVHVYIFENLPGSPRQALAALSSAQTSLWCNTIGLEDDRGGRELRADWFIDDTRSPVLKKAGRPFRPSPAPGMQQVRVKARQLSGDFEYLFEQTKAKFEPVFDRNDAIELPADRREEVASLKLVPPEDLPWFRVTGLQRQASEEETPYKAALRELSPESGAFVLMSVRRRDV